MSRRHGGTACPAPSHDEPRTTKDVLKALGEPPYVSGYLEYDGEDEEPSVQVHGYFDRTQACRDLNWYRRERTPNPGVLIVITPKALLTQRPPYQRGIILASLTRRTT